jgi:hypothetical protein
MEVTMVKMGSFRKDGAERAAASLVLNIRFGSRFVEREDNLTLCAHRLC